MANPRGNPKTLKPYQPKWQSGKTQTIRVPIAIAQEVLEAAKLIDSGETLVTEKQVEETTMKIQTKQSNTVTGDRKLIIKSFEELVAVRSNRGGQMKEIASEIAWLLGIDLYKTPKGWIITEATE